MIIFLRSGSPPSPRVIPKQELHRATQAPPAQYTASIKATSSSTPIPPTLDVPQTGANSNLGFWIGLRSVALGGLVPAGIMAIKRKRDDDSGRAEIYEERLLYCDENRRASLHFPAQAVYEMGISSPKDSYNVEEQAHGGYGMFSVRN